MELRHLRYFITVAEELNFSKAGLKLYTAQPSLSQQIKDLEEDVGVLSCAVQNGLLGIESSVSESVYSFVVEHLVECFIVPYFDLLDFV